MTTTIRSHPAEALVLAKIPEPVIQRASAVKLMIFDVDGVLTDGSLLYSDQGELIKRFHVLDGHGLKMLTNSGVRVALVTARESNIVSIRAAELGIGDVFQGVRNKAGVVADLASRASVAMENVGFMGDDVVDLHAMQRVGFAVTVPNAPPYVALGAHWTTIKQGGYGAVRECCDLILAAQGKLGQLLQPGRLPTGQTIQ